MKVHPDKEDAFVELCERMEKAVAEHEPETLHYKFYRLREPHAFAVIESFKDEAADEAHQQAPHFKEIAPGMIDCLDGGYVREYLDPLKAS
ncbi:MAG: putative quinol monooxygenase [Parvularculaceae bacterium]